MRRFLIALIALVGMGATGLAFAQAAGPDGTGIQSSPHDFTDNLCFDTASYDPGDPPGSKTYGAACTETTWNDSLQLCAVCHTPHNPETPNAVDTLLWNHDDSAATGWTMYDSASMDADPVSAPSGLALACLGCHDGIQGIDVFGSHLPPGTEVLNDGGGGVYGTSAIELTYGVLSGTTIDGQTDHPVSVVYDNTNDLELHDPAVEQINGAIIEKRLEQSGADFLIQCHSCHDVHNNSTNDEWLLREPILEAGGGEASQLCLACHDK